jgi:predicted MFS family arabinose efflux permease
VLTLLLYAALSGTFFFFTLNLIQVQGYSATAAGASLLPFVVIMFSLSRWSGGLIARFGPRLPLMIGPATAAVGFALYAIPSVNHNYWTSFFPAVIVLGLGMAITVAPLTTTVMGSVSEAQAGVASGINNAVSRTAGLLAVAVFGVVILHAFSNELGKRLAELPVDQQYKQAVYDQRVKLAGLELPVTSDPQTGEQLKSAVAAAFVSGFRLLMLLSAALALASALSSWWWIGRSRPRQSRHQKD